MEKIDWPLVLLRSLQGFVALAVIAIVCMCLVTGIYIYTLKKERITVTERIYKIPDTSLLLRMVDPYPRGLAIIMITDSMIDNAVTSNQTNTGSQNPKNTSSEMDNQQKIITEEELDFFNNTLLWNHKL